MLLLLFSCIEMPQSKTYNDQFSKRESSNKEESLVESRETVIDSHAFKTSITDTVVTRKVEPDYFSISKSDFVVLLDEQGNGVYSRVWPQNNWCYSHLHHRFLDNQENSKGRSGWNDHSRVRQKA